MSHFPSSAFAAVLTRCAAERLGIARVQLAADQLERLWSSVRPQPTAASVGLPPELGGGFLPWDVLVEAITVRETYFFRHPEQLELLRQHVLPAQRERGQHPFRVWSAGCASGEEAYSLAILCHREGMLENTHVLGTDVCHAALELARAACYRDWSLRGLAPEQLSLHFERRDSLHCVREHLRRRVTFRTLNLTEPRYPLAAEGTAGLSLICCRNVLMFLDHRHVQPIAARLFEALAPGGFLLTGPSDPNLSGPLAWDVLATKAGLLYRKPTAPRKPHAHPLDPSTHLIPFEPEPERVPEPVPLPIPAPQPPLDPAASVRRTWNEHGAAPALVRCQQALSNAASSLELHYLSALLHWELGQHTHAVSSMRKVLYLDREQPVAHFGLAVLLERSGELEAARRSYRNALLLCESLTAESALPLGDGICAAGMQTAAQQALQRLPSGKASA